ncbi:ImmA/IrrE family metallo-endopeptidase [Agromyces sp. NPDC058484]|uniref:ImmA/IrrE family metallo-endopeptidase n=1 Tax=Agromyces sp. NPDC058484 TaxID=3346524 RepID=UPI00364B3CF2
MASFDALETTWAEGSVAYRRVAVTREAAPELETWLTLGERTVDYGELKEFDRPGLERLLPDLRVLSGTDPASYIPECVRSLAQVGVALRFVPPIPGLGIYGATRWVRGRPIVQLSLRQKTDDQLWFTLFHEFGHILLHSQNGLYLTGDAGTPEEEADQFAADALIPPAYLARLPRRRDLAAVRALADELGVAPGIVLGRAQRETGDYAWGHSLKQRFDFVAEESAP